MVPPENDDLVAAIADPAANPEGSTLCLGLQSSWPATGLSAKHQKLISLAAVIVAIVTRTAHYWESGSPACAQALAPSAFGPPEANVPSMGVGYGDSGTVPRQTEPGDENVLSSLLRSSRHYNGGQRETQARDGQCKSMIQSPTRREHAGHRVSRYSS